MSTAARLVSNACANLRPDPRLLPDQWADAHRYLTSGETRRPGLWSTDIVPFTREIMRYLSVHDPTPAVVCMWASQIAKTEMGLNWLGYVIDCAPGPFMMLRPKIEDAEWFSKQRLKHLFSVPRLKGKVAAEGSRKSSNTLRLKEFTGGLLILAGANSPSDLASWPIRYLYEDEPDRYPESAGGEGDPSLLARKRQSGFGDKAKRLTTATPTDEHSTINRQFLAGSRAHWHMPCPHCGTYQELIWREDDGTFRLKWEGDPREGQGFRVWYDCPHCHGEIEQHHKGPMLAEGVWVHEFPDRPAKSSTLNALAAPVDAVSWETLVGEWLEAIERAKSGDTEALRVFINTRLAQVFIDTGESIEAGPLESRCEDWGDTIPQGVRLLTCMVDVQDDRLEAEVKGWGRGYENWSIETYVIASDPLDQETWDDLDEILFDSSWTREDGAALKIVTTLVDAGDGKRTQEVYDYCNARAKRHVYAAKGKEGTRPIWDAKVRKGKKRSDGIAGRFHLTGVDVAKNQIESMLRVTEPGPKYCHFPAGRSSDYFQQLTAEKRVKRRNSSNRWVYRWELRKAGSRNEALDLFVGNLAALHASKSRSGKIRAALEAEVAESRARTVKPAPAPAPVPAPAPAKRPESAPTDDWFARGRGRTRGRGDPWSP